MDTPHTPPRRAARYPFVAKVALSAPGASSRIVGLTTDLSEGGCCVRVPELFERGSQIQLEIIKNMDCLQISVTVAYSLAPNVMGLSFGEMTTEQRAILNRWIEQAIPTLRRVVQEKELRLAEAPGIAFVPTAEKKNPE